MKTEQLWVKRTHVDETRNTRVKETPGNEKGSHRNETRTPVDEKRNTRVKGTPGNEKRNICGCEK